MMLPVQPLLMWGSWTSLVASGSTAPARRDPTEWVGPGMLGFLIIAGLAVATVLLWRNMNKQLRKVKFDDKPAGDRPPDEGGEPATPATPATPADARLARLARRVW